MSLRTCAFLALSLAFHRPAEASEPRILEIGIPSHDITLSGSLALPAEPRAPRAAVVFVHGSGKQTRDLGLARRFADAGIAALVYDKRGAGRSGGTYEGQQSVSERNLSLLADDAAAALKALRQRLPPDVPAGLAGISQAGWIIPLAAERSPEARFVVLWSGPVCKVSEEDIYSIHTRDADSASPPGFATALAARAQPYIWPDFLGVDTDPVPSLRKLSIPGLWIFGGRDGSIPVELSIARLRQLKRAGHGYDHLLYGDLGHNNMQTTFTAATHWILTQARTR